MNVYKMPVMTTDKMVVRVRQKESSYSVMWHLATWQNGGSEEEGEYGYSSDVGCVMWYLCGYMGKWRSEAAGKRIVTLVSSLYGSRVAVRQNSN